MTPSAPRIYRLSATCVFLAVASFIVPRFFPNPEGGFAAPGANAILVLFVMLGATLALAVFLLSMTLRAYRSIPRAARVAGIAPGVVMVIAFIALFGFLRF